MTRETVSVIVPSFNHAHYLEQCLESVFMQTYPYVEIVLIDDGSSDRSLQVARALKRHSPFEMTILAQHNRGAHEAINRGLHMAKGFYATILNSDDYFHPDRLTRCVTAAEAASSQFAFTKVGYVDQFNSDVSQVDPYAIDLVIKQNSIESYMTVGFSLLESNVAISTGNFFFTKALFEIVGEFDNLRYCHDWDYILRSLLHAEPLYIDETLYYYRLHRSNSFRDLADVARHECPYLMRKFFSLGKTTVQNPLAPTANNWGEYFWTFIERIRYATYLAKPVSGA
jgi:glycosyltransferase involved in cell wall biosynthesis